MKVKEIIKVLNLEELTDCPKCDAVSSICASDLMSEVLRFADKNCLMLTNLLNLQTIRTAEMVESKGILFVRGRRPTQSMIDLADKKHIPLFVTSMTMFEVCGILYKLMENHE